MDKVLVTTLLTMAAVVAAVMVVNTMLPALGRSTSAVLSSSTAASDRLKTDTEIIHVATDTSAFKVYAWVKNTGATEITAIDSGDLFYKTSSTFDRLPYNASASCPGSSCWSYTIEDDTIWSPGVTIKVTVHLTTLPTGNYLVRFVTRNAVVAEKEFTV